MRVWDVVWLIVALPIIVVGIIYVPRHDGRTLDLLLAVILPTIIVCRSLFRIICCCCRDRSGTHDVMR
ncbi:MAG: hypothetical protein ABFC96_16935 [Thermoguttaceae bacterium]